MSTLRRRRDALTAHGATAAEDGWVIPIPALVAVGLLDRVTPPDAPASNGLAPATTPPDDTALASLRQELAGAHLARVSAEHRAQLAEAIADERGRNLEDVRRALRALTAAPAPTPQAAPTSEPTPAATPAPAAAPAAPPLRASRRREPTGPRSWFHRRR